MLESRLAADGEVWPSQTVLDLFAGSGALGLEALSRGAGHAVLVESDREAARIARANAEALDLPAVVVARSVRAPGQPPGGPATVVLADPPYDWASMEVAEVLRSLVTGGWIAAGALVVVERSARDDDSPLPGGTAPSRRAFGSTALWYGRLTVGDATVAPQVREGEA